jgi:integrase
MAKKTRKKPEKQHKPYEDFPLHWHPNGQWSKSVQGKRRYYGSDWRQALKKFHREHEGESLTLDDAVEKYKQSCQLRESSKEIGIRHLKDIEGTLARLTKHLGHRLIKGLKSEDWQKWRAEIAKTNGPVALGGHITRVRAFLNWCQREKIADFPVGDSLKKPSRPQLRLERARRGSKMWEPEELRRLLLLASPMIKAWVLLGLNCALANDDVAKLTHTFLKKGWLVYPRPKTGIQRRIPLWPETQVALVAFPVRPGDDVVFRTLSGNMWTSKSKTKSDSPISLKFRVLLKNLGLYKKGRGFGSLRHVAQTIGEKSRDKVAVDALLGHVDDSVAEKYREVVDDERLLHVTNTIHDWLFTPAPTQVTVIQQSVKKTPPTMRKVAQKTNRSSRGCGAGV